MSQDELIDRLRIDSAEPPSAGQNRVWWVVAVVLVVAALVVAWLTLFGSDAIAVETIRPEQVEVETGEVRSSVLDGSGYVVARRQATVAAEVTGKLIEVHVEEGMMVEADQVLAQIDPATEQAQLELSLARLNAARSALAEIEAQLDNAIRTRTRQHELRDRELTSQSEVDRVETDVDALTARLASQHEQIKVSEREVALQRRRLQQLTIRAPFSGVVIARAAQAGEMVSPVSAGGGFTRTGICTIVDMDSLEIEVDVNEAYIDRVQPGQAVIARLDAYPDWEISAEVHAVVPTADRQKATVRVRVAFLERDPRILPEMGISVRFLETESTEHSGAATGSTRVLRIPRHTIVSAQGRDYVYVVSDHRVERRAVRLGAIQGEAILVTAGLSGNEDLVAHAGEQDLNNNARVRVNNP